MNKTLQKTTTRNYLWDNIKTFLIFTVVIGHFLENFVIENDPTKALDYWIYTFHMPAFLFVSGYWAKNYCIDGKVKIQKAGNLLAYFIVFQVLFLLIAKSISPDTRFTLFYPAVGLWYLLAMVAYYLIIPFAEKLPAYIILPTLAILGLLIGCEESAGTFLSASRTIVFAFFFFLGYYTPEKLINKLRNMKYHIVIGICSTLLSIAIWSTIIIFWTRDTLPMRMFYGKHSYDFMGFTNGQGILLRIVAWIISLLMLISLITLTSEKKNHLSYIGKNSLQIFLLHFIPFIILSNLNITDKLPIKTLTQGIIHVVLAIAFTFLLSLPVFSYPFKWIQTGVDKIFCLKKK